VVGQGLERTNRDHEATVVVTRQISPFNGIPICQPSGASSGAALAGRDSDGVTLNRSGEVPLAIISTFSAKHSAVPVREPFPVALDLLSPARRHVVTCRNSSCL